MEGCEVDGMMKRGWKEEGRKAEHNTMKGSSSRWSRRARRRPEAPDGHGHAALLM